MRRRRPSFYCLIHFYKRLNTPTDIMAANLFEKLSEMFSSLKADDGDDEEEEEEEDLVDPATVIKEKCAETDCTKYKDRLDKYTTRVQSKNKTTETCFEEILDFYHCADHCASDKIFKHVK